jgi:hypothetical protein
LIYGEINLLRENEKALSWRNQQAGYGNTPVKNPSTIAIATGD